VTLVALHGATAGHGYLRVSVGKAEFKDAPSFAPDAELSISDEASAYRHYGMDYRPVGHGARRLAKH
jgi:hypothetical protein